MYALKIVQDFLFFAVQVAIQKYCHPWITRRKCCITVVKWTSNAMYTHLFYCCLLACLGTNTHQFSIRLPNIPNAMNNILFYCSLCVASWYTYDCALLCISLAFSTLVWRLQECRYSIWRDRERQNRERMPKRYVIASGISGVVNWESRTLPLLY